MVDETCIEDDILNSSFCAMESCHFFKIVFNSLQRLSLVIRTRVIFYVRISTNIEFTVP